jgi:predicted peptidase
MKFLQISIKVIFVLLIVGCNKIDRYLNFLNSQKGKIIFLNENKFLENDSLKTDEVIIKDDKGTEIEFLIQFPKGSIKPLPVVVVLGGIDIGRETLEYLENPGNVILVAPDYPYKLLNYYNFVIFLKEIPKIRKAGYKTNAGIRLIVDYLYQRKDIDTTRISLAGYSFGAPFVPSIAVLEKRFKACAIVYGGGDIASLIQKNLQSRFLGWFGGYLFREIEPLLYVDKMPQKHLLFINGLYDEFFPPENAKLLIEKANEPKDVIWIESGHMDPMNEKLIKRKIDKMKKWFKNKQMI